MDYIKSWSFCICITLIISVIFSILSPKGTMGKFYKVIISVFIFISFLYPLSDFDFSDFDLDFDFEQEYENVAENAAKTQIELSVNHMLEENDIRNCNVSADVMQSGDEIYINRVSVAVTDAYSPEEVEEIIFKKLGIVADVKHIGE